MTDLSYFLLTSSSVIYDRSVISPTWRCSPPNIGPRPVGQVGSDHIGSVQLYRFRSHSTLPYATSLIALWDRRIVRRRATHLALLRRCCRQGTAATSSNLAISRALTSPLRRRLGLGSRTSSTTTASIQMISLISARPATRHRRQLARDRQFARRGLPLR